MPNESIAKPFPPSPTGIQIYREIVNRLVEQRRVATATFDNVEDKYQDALGQCEIAEAAVTHAKNVAESVQEQAHKQIASVVSKCLEAVFDEPYEFKIIFEQKRNNTEARLVFVRDGMEIDPISASGGGVVDVAAFALRLSCLMLSRPLKRRFVVLDEPFKFVSDGYRDNVRVMLESLAKDMGVQFVMVTHIAELQMGKVVAL